MFKINSGCSVQCAGCFPKDQITIHAPTIEGLNAAMVCMWPDFVEDGDLKFCSVICRNRYYEQKVAIEKVTSEPTVLDGQVG